MVLEIGPDPLLTCPLDESHRILKSRMQFHLVRCAKNHKLGSRLKCPWNPLHIIDKFIYIDHCTRDCEDLPRNLCHEEETRDVGSVPATATNSLLPPSEENWDAEPGNVGTYDPTKNAEGRPVLRIAVGLSKAQKKQHRQAERKRFQDLEAMGPIQTPARKAQVPKPTEALRAPLTTSKNLSRDTSMMSELDSTQCSDCDKKSRRKKSEPQALRPPHEPSLTFSYKADIPNGKNRGNGKNQINAEDEARALDEVPKLCHSLSKTFINSWSVISSSGCSGDRSKTSRRMQRNNIDDIPNLNDSRASFSESEKSVYADQSNGIPNLVQSGAETEEDKLAALLHFNNQLAASRKNIEDTKARMRQRRAVWGLELRKMRKPTVSLQLIDKTRENAMMDNYSLRRYLHGDSDKCAANSPTQSSTSMGRGLLMTADSFREYRPGPTPAEMIGGINNIGGRSEKVNRNPFEIGEGAFGGISFRQTYDLRAANGDHTDSD